MDNITTKDLIASNNKLYDEISSCIEQLVKARLSHNNEVESMCLFKMESLMVDTEQQLTCINDYLMDRQNNGWIKIDEKHPLPEGIEVIGYNKEWINIDFNLYGTRVGFYDGDGHFISAKWVNDQDCYATCYEEGDDYETTQTLEDGKEVHHYWKNGEPIEGHLPNMPTHYMPIPSTKDIDKL